MEGQRSQGGQGRGMPGVGDETKRANLLFVNQGAGEDGLADLPLIAAALAHFEEAGRVAGAPQNARGQRSRWGLAARRGALRGGSWS